MYLHDENGKKDLVISKIRYLFIIKTLIKQPSYYPEVFSNEWLNI